MNGSASSGGDNARTGDGDIGAVADSLACWVNEGWKKILHWCAYGLSPAIPFGMNT